MATLSVSLNKDEENKALELRRALLFCIRERPTCHLDGGCDVRAPRVGVTATQPGHVQMGTRLWLTSRAPHRPACRRILDLAKLPVF